MCCHGGFRLCHMLCPRVCHELHLRAYAIVYTIYRLSPRLNISPRCPESRTTDLAASTTFHRSHNTFDTTHPHARAAFLLTRIFSHAPWLPQPDTCIPSIRLTAPDAPKGRTGSLIHFAAARSFASRGSTDLTAQALLRLPSRCRAAYYQTLPLGGGLRCCKMNVSLCSCVALSSACERVSEEHISASRSPRRCLI